MNRFLLFAVGVAMILGLAFAPQPTSAQVFGEYGVTKVLQGIPYQEITSPTVVAATKFALPPTFPQNTLAGRDDGYYLADIGFDFEYNGEKYTKVWICVNGFIMFASYDYNGNIVNPPSTLLPKNGLANYATWFFNYSESYPMNVVAPYMGDHFYRTGDDNPIPTAPQYMNSEISYKTDKPKGGDTVFTVQWKNLNINFDDPANPTPTAGITSSVGNFQLKIYKSKERYSRQGDIQFCYGQVGGNTKTNDTRIITKGAAIGLKGNSEMENVNADFLNGLYSARSWVPDDFTRYNSDSARMVRTVTDLWQPSGGTDYRIHFTALGRNQKNEFWGDGDVDLSSLEGQKHAGMDQPRYSTVADARFILRSIVLNKPLAKERRREAYHGDVNHNGRFFFYSDNNYYDTVARAYVTRVFRKDLPWKNEYFGDSLQLIQHPVWNTIQQRFVNTVVPSNIKSLAQLYYQVTEYDAALIMHYIGGRLPYLPWLLDTIPQYGKISNDVIANGLIAGKASSIGNNTYSIPVYLNGSNHGPIALKADANVEISTINACSDVMSDVQNNTVVLAGSTDLNNDQPVFNMIVKTDANQVTLSNIRYNDNEVAPITINLSDNVAVSSNVAPNPFSNNTTITLNIANTSNYTLKIYDVLGNVVKTLANGELKSGATQFVWDGTDENGNKANTGTYIYRLIGEGTNISDKVMLAR